MRKYILALLILLLVALPVFAPEESQVPVNKKYDFSFSLSGGNISGKFNLTGDFLYAREFGKLFVQAAGFANLGQTKEYGGSFGLGTSSDASGMYLFADYLNSYGKSWMQLRPTVRLKSSWMSLTAFYALPITKSTIQISGEEISAVTYWGGEVSIVPMSWTRFYGDLMFIGKIYTYRFGAEVRPIKWFSLSVDWNKTDSGIYSKWNSYQDVRITANLLFGGQQRSFSPAYRIQVTPKYPILARKTSDVPERTNDEVEFMYQRTLPIIFPNNPGPSGMMVTQGPGQWGGNPSGWSSIGLNQWTCSIILQYSQAPYYAYTVDMKVTDGYIGVARTIFARIRGQNNWIQLTVIENNLEGEGEWARFILDKNGIRQ